MSTDPQDRVSYSYGFTVPGDEAYSSRRVDIAIETALRVGETADQALARARGFVMSECDRELGQVRRAGAAPPPAPPPPRSRVEDEAFDPNNQNHLNLANIALDAEGIRSEKARGFKIAQLLPGERVGDIGKIIRADEEAFRVKRRDGTRSNWNGQFPPRTGR